MSCGMTVVRIETEWLLRMRQSTVSTCIYVLPLKLVFNSDPSFSNKILHTNASNIGVHVSYAFIHFAPHREQTQYLG